jgi:hypothetical protein
MYTTHPGKQQQNSGRGSGDGERGRALRWLPLAALAMALAAPALTVADNPALQLVGEARLKVLLWSVYDSRLYTPDGDYREGQRPLRMEIEYLLDIESAKLVERTAQEWRAMGRSHPAEDAWLERLGALWPDIDSGDVIALELDADNQATFFHNGDKLGNLEHPEFGQQFIDIWLSPDTTRPQLRLALLGKD